MANFIDFWSFGELKKKGFANKSKTFSGHYQEIKIVGKEMLPFFLVVKKREKWQFHEISSISCFWTLL